MVTFFLFVFALIRQSTTLSTIARACLEARWNFENRVIWVKKLHLINIKEAKYLIYILFFTGRLYAALGKRGGRVIGSDLQSGSASFRVRALLPVAESFKFAMELRTHTSGLAAPQLMFSHWEVKAYFMF